MSRPIPTLEEVTDWGITALCSDEEKRARAVRNLTFAYFTQREIIANFEAKLDQMHAQNQVLEARLMEAKQ